MSACTNSSASLCTALTSGKASLQRALAATHADNPGLSPQALAQHALVTAASQGDIPACGLTCPLRQRQVLALARQAASGAADGAVVHP